jgi:hypothetical protein
MQSGQRTTGPGFLGKPCSAQRPEMPKKISAPPSGAWTNCLLDMRLLIVA